MITYFAHMCFLCRCREDLMNLKQVWETFRVIDEQQSQWMKHRWQKMNTAYLREETNKQVEVAKALPEEIFTWDVYMGLYESITTIQVRLEAPHLEHLEVILHSILNLVLQACLPLIDDLSNPAMRTRHWKQLVRVTGGAFQIDNDTLKRMTLGELLSLGLQSESVPPHVPSLPSFSNPHLLPPQSMAMTSGP